MTEPFDHAPTLGGPQADESPDAFAPMLGGPGAPPPPPLYRADRDRSKLAALGMYWSRPGRTGFVPALGEAAAQAFVEQLLAREGDD